MVTVDEIKERLADEKEALRRFKVGTLAVFGSVARGNARPDSDVDLLVEFIRLQRILEGLLDSRVNLVTASALGKSKREDILREAVRAA